MSGKTSSPQGSCSPAHSQACSFSRNKASPLPQSTQHSCQDHKYNVHGKQCPQGASKMSWRQDDQPCGRAGHVMTHMCHRSKARRMASVTIQVPMQGICTPATRIALWPAKLPSQAMSSSRPRARWPVKTCEKRTCDNLGGCVQVKEEPNYN